MEVSVTARAPAVPVIRNWQKKKLLEYNSTQIEEENKKHTNNEQIVAHKKRAQTTSITAETPSEPRTN